MSWLTSVGRVGTALAMTAAVGLAWTTPAYADPSGPDTTAAEAHPGDLAHDPAQPLDVPTQATPAPPPPPAPGDEKPADEEPTAQPPAPGIARPTPPDPTSAPADTTAAEPAGTCGTAPATVTVTTSAPVLGGSVTLTGTGWCNPAGGGSVIGVKIDEGVYSRLNTEVHANKTIWAIVEAEDDGTFTADIELPDGTPATSAPAFATGEHSLRLLSGSLAPGDQLRSVVSASFDVSSATDPAAPVWSHEKVASNGATAWVEREVAPGRGFRIKGTGWTHGRGGPSTLVVKLNISENGGQARRTGSQILLRDDTIWALLDADDISAAGSFEVTVDAPPGLTAGQYFTVSLFTGKFAAGDTQRTATTPPLVVDGVAWEGGDDSSDVTCVPTTATPTVTIETPSVAFGEPLRVTGTGWCNPAGGGSVIGVKIDEGGISHLDSSVHANRTIWAIVRARHRDGTFTADIELPDGTTATSTPALAPGAHTLRLLSGSLVAGDQVRSLQSEEFVVGHYRPNGIPEPVTLHKGNRNGLTVKQDGRRITVRVPLATKGDWVHLSAYTVQGSPRHPWGATWFRTDARGRISTRLPVTEEISGKHRLVAQSGNLGEAGKLLGWDTVTFGDATRDKNDEEPPPPPQVRPTPASPAPTVAQQATLSQPPAPVPADQLTSANRGKVTGTLKGSTLTLKVPAARPARIAFVTAYVGRVVVPIGGAVVDDQKRLLVDLGDLLDTDLRLAVQTPSGELLGWYRHRPVPDDEPAPVAEAAPEQAAPIDSRVATTTDDQARVGTIDAVLAGAGLALLLAAWGFVAVRRRGVEA